jgi:hypothetical protein
MPCGVRTGVVCVVRVFVTRSQRTDDATVTLARRAEASLKKKLDKMTKQGRGVCDEGRASRSSKE